MTTGTRPFQPGHSVVSDPLLKEETAHQSSPQVPLGFLLELEHRHPVGVGVPGPLAPSCHKFLHPHLGPWDPSVSGSVDPVPRVL